MFARLINIALRLVCPRRSALSSSASVVTPVVCPLAFVLPPSNAALVCRTLCMLPQTRGPLALVLRSSIVSLLHYFALFLAFDVGFGFAFFFFSHSLSQNSPVCAILYSVADFSSGLPNRNKKKKKESILVLEELIKILLETGG